MSVPTRKPRIAVSQLCLPRTTFAEDLRIARSVGFDGISIDERKLASTSPGSDAEMLRASGLEAVIGCPTVWSIFPLPNFPNPPEPDARIEAICAGIRRLAPLGPAAVLCAAGSAAAYEVEEARGILIRGLQRIASAASSAGIRLSFEPMTRESMGRIANPIVTNIPETLELLDEAKIEGSQIIVDVWHLFDSPGLLEQVRRYAPRIVALQACDYQPPRTPRDRRLPGDGLGNVPAILAALEGGGFNGWLELEVFSDELWKLPPVEFMRRGFGSILDCWERRT